MICDFAAALKKLIEDDSMRLNMGERAFDRIQNHYTWSKRIYSMNEIYQELINGYAEKI